MDLKHSGRNNLARLCLRQTDDDRTDKPGLFPVQLIESSFTLHADDQSRRRLHHQHVVLHRCPARNGASKCLWRNQGRHHRADEGHSQGPRASGNQVTCCHFFSFPISYNIRSVGSGKIIQNKKFQLIMSLTEPYGRVRVCTSQSHIQQHIPPE